MNTKFIKIVPLMALAVVCSCNEDEEQINNAAVAQQENSIESTDSQVVAENTSTYRTFPITLTVDKQKSLSKVKASYNGSYSLEFGNDNWLVMGNDEVQSIVLKEDNSEEGSETIKYNGSITVDFGNNGADLTSADSIKEFEFFLAEGKYYGAENSLSAVSGDNFVDVYNNSHLLVSTNKLIWSPAKGFSNASGIQLENKLAYIYVEGGSEDCVDAQWQLMKNGEKVISTEGSTISTKTTDNVTFKYYIGNDNSANVTSLNGGWYSFYPSLQWTIIAEKKAYVESEEDNTEYTYTKETAINNCEAGKFYNIKRGVAAQQDSEPTSNDDNK